jgi:hypothetical protein
MSDMGFARARVTSGLHEMNIKVLNTILCYSCTYTPHNNNGGCQIRIELTNSCLSRKGVQIM